MLVQRRLILLDSLREFRALLLVGHGQHPVAAEAVRLDREHRRLVRHGCITEFVNPLTPVEALNWRHSALLLVVANDIVVGTWRVKPQKHGLGREDRVVGPHTLDENLRDVVFFVQEIILLLLDVPVAEFVADQVLLPDAERSELARHRRRGLVSCVRRQVQERLRVLRAGGADLIDVLDVLVGGRRIRETLLGGRQYGHGKNREHLL